MRGDGAVGSRPAQRHPGATGDGPEVSGDSRPVLVGERVRVCGEASRHAELVEEERAGERTVEAGPPRRTRVAGARVRPASGARLGSDARPGR